MQREDRIRLRHMLEAAREAVVISKASAAPEPASSRIRVLAVTRLIEVVGEAASRVSEGARAELPTIPGRRSSG